MLPGTLELYGADLGLTDAILARDLGLRAVSDTNCENLLLGQNVPTISLPATAALSTEAVAAACSHPA